VKEAIGEEREEDKHGDYEDAPIVYGSNARRLEALARWEEIKKELIK
jgi:hypothetical protein